MTAYIRPEGTLQLVPENESEKITLDSWAHSSPKIESTQRDFDTQAVKSLILIFRNE